MKTMKVLVWTIWICLTIPVAFATEYSASDFLNEFNDPGETCTFDSSNYFYYYTENKEKSLAVFYRCCSESSCVDLAFDVSGKKPYALDDGVTLFNSRNILNGIGDGTISTEIYNYADSFNSCSFLGSDELEDQSINLASDTFEVVKSDIPEPHRSQISLVKKIGKAFGRVEKFNIVAFGGSVFCNRLTGVEKDAFEQLYKCHEQLKYIQDKVSYFGITQNMKDCNEQARAMLSSYLDSDVNKAKGFADATGNTIKGTFNFFTHLTDENNQFHIEDSNYKKLQNSYDRIRKEDPHLEDPSAPTLAKNSVTRFTQKSNTLLALDGKIHLKDSEISSSKPFGIGIFVSNLFLEPNYNTTGWDSIESEIESSYSNFTSERESSHFNTASVTGLSVLEKQEQYIEFVDNENQVERHLDRRWVYSTIALLTVLVLAVIIFWPKKPQDEIPSTF